MNTESLSPLILKVFVSAIATVGIIEFGKNFIKTTKSWVYSVSMPFVAIGCYCACEFFNYAVIGSILTVGTVQLCYQTLVQGFKKVVNGKISKLTGSDNEPAKDYSDQ